MSENTAKSANEAVRVSWFAFMRKFHFLAYTDLSIDTQKTYRSMLLLKTGFCIQPLEVDMCPSYRNSIRFSTPKNIQNTDPPT